ncbi:hypothetical protein BH23GEM6_BH23GEM6_08430 [soil metagenome]
MQNDNGDRGDRSGPFEKIGEGVGGLAGFGNGDVKRDDPLA